MAVLYVPRIVDAVKFLETKIGKWKYDHEAAANTRFGQNDREADCSGAEIASYLHVGWKRYTEGFPESSGSMALWAESHPKYLLWKHTGGGRYRTFDEAMSIYGSTWILNGPHNGDDGHTGFSKAQKTRNGWLTLECASGLKGVNYGDTGRFGGSNKYKLTHVLLAPGMAYGMDVTDPLPRKRGKMFWIVKGDAKGPAGDQWWLTDGWVWKRKIGDLGEANAIKNSGVLEGKNNTVTWPQVYVDRIPVAH